MSIMEYTDFLVLVIILYVSQHVYAQWLPQTTTLSPEPFDIRLNGPTVAEGRLEVQHQGSWGTVCDDHFGLPEATVACQQLGYDFAVAVKDSAYYGEGNGNILLDDVNCEGNEKSLSECRLSEWGVHNCAPSEDVGVQCSNYSEPFDIRLVDGPTTFEGRLEVHRQGIWGTVCDDNFDSTEADVVCRQLGYDYALEVKGSAFYGQGDGNILLDEIDCKGDENLLSQCYLMGWGSHNCNPSEDVGVRCGNVAAGELPIKLSDPSRPNRGNVQVFYNGSWGYICDADWRTDEATVACRQLGYEGSARFYDPYSDHGGLDSDIVISSIDCLGYETNLSQCSIEGVNAPSVAPNPWDSHYNELNCWGFASVICRTSAEGGLTAGKIAGITVTCILVTIMLIIIPLIILRCKKPKNAQPQTPDSHQQANGVTTNGTLIPADPTTVMYVNSPTGVPQVMMPYGSPSVAYAQNGQIIYPQQPVVFQSQPQTNVSPAYPNGMTATGLSVGLNSVPPQENKTGAET